MYTVCTRSSSPHTHTDIHPSIVSMWYHYTEVLKCVIWILDVEHECLHSDTFEANVRAVECKEQIILWEERCANRPKGYGTNWTPHKHTNTHPWVMPYVRRLGASLVDVGNLLSIRRGKREIKITHRRSRKSERGRKISRETRTGEVASKGCLFNP